jgi:hypothetical protein
MTTDKRKEGKKKTGQKVRDMQIQGGGREERKKKEKYQQQ